MRALQDLAPAGHAEPVAECITCDLSSLRSVRGFAADCLARLEGPPGANALQVLPPAGADALSRHIFASGTTPAPTSWFCRRRRILTTLIGRKARD